MGYLERVFLGTLVLTGLLIFFLFGLYFDVGGMVAGSFGGARLGFGQDLEAVRQRRRLVHDPSEDPPERPRPAPSGTKRMEPSGPIDYGRFVRTPPSPPLEVLIEREARRLKRKGFTDEEYIRMQAVYVADRSLVRVFDQYDRLVNSGSLDEALALLLDAKKHLDPKNPLAMRDLLQYLGQIYLLTGDEKKAQENLRELMALQERVLAIEKRADQHKDEQGQEYLAKVQEGFGQLREALDKIETAPPGYTSPFKDSKKWMDPNGKLPVSPQGMQLIKAHLLDKVGKGGEDGITEEQMREAIARFQVQAGP